MEKIKISMIVFFILLSSIFVAAETNHFSNSAFEFDYDSSWKIMDNKEELLFSTENNLIFYSLNENSLAFISRFSESEYSTMGNVEEYPAIEITSKEETEIFSLPATKYKAIINETDLSGYGEFIVSEVSEGYFYRVSVIAEKENYVPFEFFTSNSDTTNGNEKPNTDSNNQPVKEIGLLEWLIGLISGFFNWLFSLFG
ncbi:MAG: hypothetical protein ABIH20_04475 [Candidatus Diapherotrites archaeon]